MLVIVGVLVVVGCVLGGYAMHHGPMHVLNQPSEFIIIFGAAIGATIVMSPLHVLKALLKALMATLKPSKVNQKDYLKLLVTMFKLFKVAAYQGANGLEPHVERPHESSIVSENKMLINDHHALDFLCDTLKVVIIGGVPDYQIAELTDLSLDSHHEEEHQPINVLTKVADSMPGLGIVAAVLGIIITMQNINGSPEQIGQSVGAALVGTFVGVLFAYGFIGPLAGKMEFNALDGHYKLKCLQGCVLSYARGFHPLVSVEFGRRSLPSHLRPSFQDLESACREEGKS
ncbi:flagellar motor stator protein MotA [bacterium]|nr:flagellar motor stator protein MotA [bacterium]